MLIESSKDILNLVAALSILMVAVTLSMLIYQFTKIIREIRSLSKLIKDKVELVDSLLRSIKDKLEHSTTYFTMLVELVSKIVDFQKRRNSEIPKQQSSDPESQ